MLSPSLYQRILAIRLGALGDMVLCAPAFQAIRAAYPRAIFTLLTQKPWVDFARAMPWFDHVITDTRAAVWQAGDWLDLRRRVKDSDPQCVFDLQGKARQDILYWLLGGPWGGVHWSGAAWRCRYPRIWPPRPEWHFSDFIRAQLQAACVPWPENPDYDWLDAPVDQLDLLPDYALIIPGCSPSRPEKRWPHYAALARRLQAEGLAVAMAGARAEAEVLAGIKAEVPAVIDLGGQTSLPQLGGVARRARIVVGNDTGPSHIAAAVGAPTLTLFTGGVNPVWSCPRGKRAEWLQEATLADLQPDRVMERLRPMLAGGQTG